MLLQGELKLTVLVTWETGKGIIQIHVAALPSRPKPPVKVQVTLAQPPCAHLCFICGQTGSFLNEPSPV